MKQTILDLCCQFDLTGELLSYKVISTGNINTTIQVEFLKEGKPKKYILQRINKYVFKKPEEVMQNIASVTSFIENILKEKGLSTDRRVLKFLYSKEGNSFIIDKNGEYFRVYEFVDDSVCYNKTSDLKVLEETGKAFGEFQSILSCFPINDLFLTIKNFHNVCSKYNHLREILPLCQVDKLEKAKEEVEELFLLEEKACQINKLEEKGELPLRVTHNDTKCNNVLFDRQTKKYLCVIDLDTVMPGLVGSDYGDAIRFGASTSAEDEENLEKVKLDLAKFESFTKGFLSKVRTSLTKTEIDTLALSTITITTELALRFLTDYLEGDVYFKTNYDEHNLVRAKCQLALAKDMIKKFDQMQEIVYKYAYNDSLDLE